MTKLTIAIDGPSGSGKSSTARGVANQLGLAYLDTGAMYRAVACEYLRAGLSPEATEEITALALGSDLTIGTNPAEAYVTINGRDVTTKIREPEVSSCVSVVARIPAVREHLTAIMRRAIDHADGRIVVEGRDITTVVAPDAQVRVLLVADPQARVRRRALELESLADSADVTDQVIRRDQDDSAVSNFTEPAQGVTVVDSTLMTLEEVIAHIMNLASQAL